MFRKLHSNRDPRDTVISELKREFNPYLVKAGNRFRSAITRHPKLVFGFMIVNIALSTVLSFTVFQRHDVKTSDRRPVKLVTPVTGGIDQIMQTSQAISEMLRLKKAIDSLSGKKHLTAQDSLMLVQALDRFQQLNTKFNQRK